MSAGLHSAREELGLPNVAPHSSASYLSLGGQQSQHHQHHQQPQHHEGGQHSSHALQKPLALSPRTFGMDDLRDFCGPLGTFKTGLTPRVFSTGLTPRSGFTPRFTTGFTPRINITGLSQQPQPHQQQQQQPSDTNAFFSRNSGYSPRASEAPQSQKISPTGFTPKDVSGMKVPMRFPGAFNTGSASPQKMGLGQPMHHTQMHHQPQYGHHPSHHDSMAAQNELAMNMSMYDYVGRPTIHQPMAHHMQDLRTSTKTSPVSEKGSEQDDLDERRRMKNRERVRKCRKRKQDRLNFLEDRTAELEKENHQLKTKIARKASGSNSSTEPLTEAQLKELRKKQNATIASYIRAHNEADAGVFDASARSIWTENAEIVYGNSGSSLFGVDTIVGNKRASSAVFAMYAIKQYNVQWKPSATDKCAVHWEVDVALRADAPRTIPLTAPFADLSSYFGPTEVLSFRMTSHVTFTDGLISEEIRQLNLSPISEVALAKFADDPKQAAAVLRCLLVAA